MIGSKFGCLTVIGAVVRTGRRYCVLCRCDCGGVKNVDPSKLKSGHTKSCGCLQKVLLAQRQTIHGRYYEPEYRAWVNMHKRCTEARWAKWYGSVSVCKRWNDYDKFLVDVGRKPTPAHTLDRIDSTKNYTPTNIRWASRAVQSRNTKNHETNTSGVRGVSWSKAKNKWRAAIYVADKQKHIGYFESLTLAADARKQAELTYWRL